MPTLGKKITVARKRKGLTQIELGSIVGLSNASISAYENDGLKGTPDAATLIRISEALKAPEILIHHCDTCPVRLHIMLKLFPDLNNIRRDPAVIVSRLRKEMMEAAEAADRLAERYSDANFKARADYREVFEREMEQIIDVKRGIEILEFELILSGQHTQEDLDCVYERQQAKCVEARSPFIAGGCIAMNLTPADHQAIADRVLAGLLPVLVAGQLLPVAADPDEPTPAQRAMMRRVQARNDLAEAQARRIARQERKKAHE